jgi:cellulose synthase/poly-beta-1,6-N-acetylglucosamine synthase-like glycosyltransferase
MFFIQYNGNTYLRKLKPEIGRPMKNFFTIIFMLLFSCHCFLLLLLWSVFVVIFVIILPPTFYLSWTRGTFRISFLFHTSVTSSFSSKTSPPKKLFPRYVHSEQRPLLITKPGHQKPCQRSALCRFTAIMFCHK